MISQTTLSFSMKLVSNFMLMPTISEFYQPISQKYLIKKNFVVVFWKDFATISYNNIE